MIGKNEAINSYPYIGDPPFPGQPIGPGWPGGIYPHTDTTAKIVLRETGVSIPELYPEDLDVLKTLMARIPTLAHIDGVYEIEIRVRMESTDSWAVIGYGEEGEPCLLRFDPK